MGQDSANSSRKTEFSAENYVEAWPQWEGPDYKIDPWSFDKDPEDDGFQKESRFPRGKRFQVSMLNLRGILQLHVFFWLFWVWSLSPNLQLRCTIWIFQCAIRHTNEHRLLQGAGSTCGWKKVVIPWVVATQTQDPAWHDMMKLDKNEEVAFMARNKPW